MLANEQVIVYNHLRDNQRILASPMVAIGNLFMVINKLQGYPLFAVGDSPFTCGGCRYMLKLQILLTATSKLLTYPYVPPFRFRKVQPPDYPHAVLI